MERTRGLPVLALAGFLLAGLWCSAAEQKGSVTARVVTGTGFIHAKQEPGEFTIKPGTKAVNLRYFWQDPKSGQKSDKLGASNVYSIDQAKYVAGPKDAPPTELPAGRYRFIVGGGVGAEGTLSWDIVPAK
jgi:hypothetical protein